MFPNRRRDLELIKTKFPSVFAAVLTLSKDIPITHEIVFQPDAVWKQPCCYPIPIAYRADAHKRVLEMLEQGIIRESSSPYVHPMLVVKKKEKNKLRVCVDFRALNLVTVPDWYTLPKIDDLKQEICGKIFTTLDLKEGFHQVRIAEDHIHKTAVKTMWGSFEYLRMPFGLRNAQPTFQRLMNQVIRGMLHN